MKNKKASISFVLLVSLVVVFAGAAILMMASNGQYNAKKEYERLENRYIAESGVDLAVGLFLNYLEKQDYVLPYSKTADGSISMPIEYVPYLLDEIRTQSASDCVKIDLVAKETADYLASIGYLGFKRGDGIEVLLNTFKLNEKYKLSELCSQPDFLLEQKKDGNKKSKLKPIYLTVKSKYKGGEVMCNVIISNLYAERNPFADIEPGESSSLSAWIDVKNADVVFENYQNYSRRIEAE